MSGAELNVGDFVVCDKDSTGYFNEQLVGYVTDVSGDTPCVQIMEPPGFPGPTPDPFREFCLV